MLNNGAASQNDAYPGLGYGQQYAQNMTSTLNAQQPGYGATGMHTKRQGAGLHQQPQMQQSLPAARRTGQRTGMPAANFAYTQYPPGRAAQGVQANTPMMRPSQSAVPSHTTQFQAIPGATRANMTSAATSAANVRGINPPTGHAGLSQVHAEASFSTQGHPMRYGIQQPPAHLQQDHSQRTTHSVLTGANRADLTPGQHGVPNPGAPGIFVGSHNQHPQVSEAAFRPRPAAAVPTNSQQRRVLPARMEPSAADKEGVLDSRDFPALGGLQGRGAAQADAAANGLSGLSLRGSVALGKGGGPLDSSDFPALNNPGGRMHGNFNTMASGGRLMHVDSAQGAGHDAFADVPAARQAPGSVRDDSENVGLKGLLPQIRSDKPSDTYMSLGVDLNAVGMDLSGQEPLYPTLSSPWSAGGRMGEVDIVLPHWFLFQPPKLHQRTMERFSTASVMAIFYIFAGVPLFLEHMFDQSLFAASLSVYHM